MYTEQGRQYTHNATLTSVRLTTLCSPENTNFKYLYKTETSCNGKMFGHLRSRYRSVSLYFLRTLHIMTPLKCPIHQIPTSDG